jgi:hypothetical protein
MMLRLALAALALLPTVAYAEGLILTTSATPGWTSNAEGMAGGQGDIFVEHSHSIGFARDMGDIALRGGLSLGETRYSRLWQENDRQIGAELSGRWRIASDMLARTTLALEWHGEGQAISTGFGVTAATTPFLKGHLGAEIESRFGDTRVATGFSYSSLTHCDTQIDAPIATVRTRADATVLGADLRLSHPVTATLAITGLARGLIQTISETDQTLFGRTPVRVIRLAGGLVANIPLRAAFELEAGADIVWSDRAGVEVSIMPYGRSEMTLALGHGFDLSTRLRTSLDFETPADGYADWVLEGRAGLGYAITQSARIEAAVIASATRSIGFDIEHKRRIGGEISAEAVFGHGFTGRASLSHARHTGFAPAFDETRLALTLAAMI